MNSPNNTFEADGYKFQMHPNGTLLPTRSHAMATPFIKHMAASEHGVTLDEIEPERAPTIAPLLTPDEIEPTR